MRVGWLAHDPGYIGGAELTQASFREAAPGGVEIVDCPVGGVVPGLDRYVAHNVPLHTMADVEAITAPVVKYQHDQWPVGEPGVRAWFLRNAKFIFCSPLHRERFPWGADGPAIPPPLEPDDFKPPRQSRRRREGICSIAGWRNQGKGAQYIEEWAADNGPVDVYGGGAFSPRGLNVHYRGELAPDRVAQTLWGYERLVFLPFELEPFCRTVAEAHFAGCEVITNQLIGALYWLERPDELRSAAEDFWGVVCG